MTNDEFHGHLMSLLNGPKGPEVAKAIVARAGMSAKDVVDAFRASGVVEAVAEIEGDIMLIMAHAVGSDMRENRLSSDCKSWPLYPGTMQARLVARFRKAGEYGRTLAERLGLEIG